MRVLRRWRRSWMRVSAVCRWRWNIQRSSLLSCRRRRSRRSTSVGCSPAHRWKVAPSTGGKFHVNLCRLKPVFLCLHQGCCTDWNMWFCHHLTTAANHGKDLKALTAVMAIREITFVLSSWLLRDRTLHYSCQCNNNNNNHFMALLSGTPWVSRYHQKKHSSNLYQLLPSTTIHSILLVQITCLAIFLHKPLSTSSLVYLLVWSPPPHIPYISSPNQCLLFAARAHTIATCFALLAEVPPHFLSWQARSHFRVAY